MKPSHLNTISRTFALFAITFIPLLAAVPHASAQLYGITNTNNANTWLASSWFTSSGGPTTNVWVSGTNAVFDSNGTYTFNGLGNLTFGDILLKSGATVMVTNSSSTAGTGGKVVKITVETNAVLDFGKQQISTTAGTGFIKEGSGVFASAPGNAGLSKGFTLNGGTMVIKGVNALGSGSTNVLTLKWSP